LVGYIYLQALLFYDPSMNPFFIEKNLILPFAIFYIKLIIIHRF